MVVQHNLPAINANRYLGINNSKLSKSLEKLSSGYQINRAGDNAAGLAVSEKMRSQIAGMKQGVKNAQDGISMVQTFEGALTETHSILQRMKTLADQMANGTYDDPVDRTAAQQEFLQLNDELNQIADTDFNGVVVLNGGKMADGAVADKNGLIDYKNQPARKAAELSVKDVKALNDTMYSQSSGKMTQVDGQWVSGTEAGPSGDKAADFWEALGLDNATDEISFTFKLDRSSGADTWTVVDSDDKNALDVAKTALKTTSTNGGFQVKFNGTGADGITDYDIKNLGVVVLDGTQLVDGDTITLTYTKPTVTNEGAEWSAYQTSDADFQIADGYKIVADSLGSTNGPDNTSYESTHGTSTNLMTKNAYDSFKALDGAKLEWEYGGAETEDGNNATLKSLTITIGEKSIKLDATNSTGTLSLVGENGTKVDYTLTLDATEPGNEKIKFEDASGKEIMDLYGFSLKNQSGAKDEAGKTSKITTTLAVATPRYDETNKPHISIKNQGEYAVSKSDAFNNSEAKLTYKDSIALQAGARTKDLVNFTFQYNSDAIGDLKADLNCTAEGLGTSKLSIATQDSANYAIDKIDQAINKVSLIRGTFGAIQNRLEHKIDNMNVSIENLTSAESQIRDTDMPTEMMEFTKNQILAQAAQSMLAQANQLPQGVLSLLQ